LVRLGEWFGEEEGVSEWDGEVGCLACWLVLMANLYGLGSWMIWW
jgi:hypothetical protein